MSFRKRLRPREPNSIANVSELISNWGNISPKQIKRFMISTAGNINATGEIAGKFAHIFSPPDFYFEESLEPRVRELVLSLVRHGGLVTYTSCEGHWYSSIKLCSDCHVGVLPRSKAELRKVWKAFKIISFEIESHLKVSKIAIYPWYLWDEKSQRDVPVIDLYLHRQTDIVPHFYNKSIILDVAMVSSLLSRHFSSKEEL